VSNDKVNFVLIGDMHIEEKGTGDGFFDKLWSAIESANPLPDFAVFLGDITQTGMPAQYDRAMEVLSRCPVPWHLVRGNHDKGGFGAMLADAGCAVPIRADKLQKLGGLYRWNALYWDQAPGTDTAPDAPTPAHYPFYERAQKPLCATWDDYRHDYTFEAGGIHFVVMDAARWIFSDKQMEFLEKELALGKPTILLMHHHLLPVWYLFDGAHVFNSQKVLALIRAHKNVVGSFHGHVHFNRHWLYDGRPFVSTGYRNWRFVSASSDGEVDVAPANVDDRPAVNYEHWNIAVTGHRGPMFRCDNPGLWRFGEKSIYASLAWGGRNEGAQGLWWDFHVGPEYIGRSFSARVCFIPYGPWDLKLDSANGKNIAHRQGKGAGERMDVMLPVKFKQPGDYRITLMQDAESDNDRMACAGFALLTYEGQNVPPLWNWGDEG